MRPVILVLALAACAATKAEVVRLAPSPALAPIAAASVRVFTTRASVPGDYVEVAIVSAKGTGWAPADEAKVLERMKQEAAALGANAIVLEAPAPASGRTVNITLDEWQPTRGRGVAIYLKP